MPRPFLSIVTRTCGRDTLADTVASVAALTGDDYEHVIIRDDEARGMRYANEQFYRHRDKVTGEYVYMLDDDDLLTRTDVVELFWDATTYGPEMVMMRFDYGVFGVLPSARMWQERRPIGTHVGTSCYLTRADVWHRHIEAFGTDTAGDYHFLATAWPHMRHVIWLDELVGKVQRKGHGKP